MNQALVQLATQYRSRGQLMMGDLLLSADDALQLCDALEQIAVPISGVNLWYYVQVREQQILAQDHLELNVSDAVLLGDNPVQESVSLAKHFITYMRPPRTVFVAVVVDAPEWMMASITNVTEESDTHRERE